MKIFVSDKGFTIIETMVAIAILTIGMSAVGLMLIKSLGDDKLNAENRQAEAVAIQQVENLRTQTTSLVSSSTVDANNAYASKWTVSQYKWLDTSMNSGLTQLDLTVGWPVGGTCTSSTPEQCPRTLSVTTYFTPITSP